MRQRADAPCRSARSGGSGWAATRRLIYPDRMLKPSHPIRTDRLILRPFTRGDLEALHAIHSLPEVTRYLYWSARDREQVAEALETKIGQTALTAEGQVLALAVELAATGELIGDGVLIWHSRLHRGGEIGYVFHPRHHGRGYATETAEALLALGFDGLDLHRIVGRLDGRNTASARVLERLGMRREAHLVANEMVKGEWTDELVYAILRHEWRARPHPRRVSRPDVTPQVAGGSLPAPPGGSGHPARAPLPAAILHLALASDWDAGQAAGEYRVSTLGRTLEQEGFIHACSDPAQLRQVARRFFRDVTDPLVLLTVDPAGLDVRLEIPADSTEPFPHIHGPLPITSVVSAVPFTIPADDR